MSNKRKLLDIEALRSYVDECGGILNGIDVLMADGHIQLPLRKIRNTAKDAILFGTKISQEDWDEFWKDFIVEVDLDVYKEKCE